MAPADEGVRVYAQDVLEELIADEYASSHADELEAYDEKLSTTKMPSVPDKTPISPAMDVRPNSRSSLFSAASSDSFWARNATTPRSSGVVKNGSMSERQLARLRAKEDRYNKLNQDYDRNQVQPAA